MSKLAVVTLGIGEETQKLLELTAPFMRKYADKVGADFVCVDKCVGDPGANAVVGTMQHPPSADALAQYRTMYQKCQLELLLRKKYARVIYLDADTLVLPSCPDLFAEVPSTHLGVCIESTRNPHSSTLMTEAYKQLGVTWSSSNPDRYFNAGVMVISAEHRHMFYLPIQPYTFWGDQTQLNYNVHSLDIPVHELSGKFNYQCINPSMRSGHASLDNLTPDNRLSAYILHYSGATEVAGRAARYAVIVEDIAKLNALSVCTMRNTDNLVAGLRDLCSEVNRLGCKTTMVEVGTYAGEGARIFSEYFSNVFAVDNWSWAEKPHSPSDVYEAFKTNTGAIPRIRLVTLDSIAAARKFDDSSLDFVYIDAIHQYANVKSDILAWKPKLKPTGLLGGHDYNAVEFPGVIAAVQEVLGATHNIRTFKDSSWLAVSKSGHSVDDVEVVTCCCGKYLDFLKMTLRHNMARGGKWLVVTTAEDVATQKFCDELGVRYTYAEPYASPYTPGAFNHGFMINAGLAQLKQDNWVAHVDCDILLPENAFVFDGVPRNHLVMRPRRFCNTIADLREYIRTGIPPEKPVRYGGTGGYFQAVNPAGSFLRDTKLWYPEQWPSAAPLSSGRVNNDNVLMRMFTAVGLSTVLPELCIHLGPGGFNVSQDSFWNEDTPAKPEVIL